MNGKDKVQIIDELALDPRYATKQELNDESIARSTGDLVVIDDLNILRRTQTQRITELDNKIEEETEKINQLTDKFEEAQENLRSNQERINGIEGSFFERIKELENENNELQLQLESANGIINNKRDEIQKLQDEIQTNSGPNDIILTFSEVPKFTLTDIISVKTFINDYLKDLVAPRMAIRHPNAEFGVDYTLVLDGLDYIDIMQGKNVTVFIKAIEEGKLNGQSSFEIKVIYHYDVLKQQEFVRELLTPAIPTSLRGLPEDAAVNYNVQNEIRNTRPLKLLIDDATFKNLPFKVFAEMNAGSYWTDFHRPWQFNRDTYLGTGQSNIGVRTTINSISDLHNSRGYHHNMYSLIEKRINDSGVSCTVTKKWIRTANPYWALHIVGNLLFNKQNITLTSDDIITSQIRNYYLMINFEVNINGVRTFYSGVTFVLTNGLELY